METEKININGDKPRSKYPRPGALKKNRAPQGTRSYDSQNCETAYLAAGAGLSAGAAAFSAGAAAFLAGAFLAAAFLAGAFLAAVFLAGAFLAAAFLAGAFFTAAFLAGAFLAAGLAAAFLQQMQGLPLLQRQASAFLHSCLGCLTASFLQSDLPQAQPAMKTDTTATRARLRNFLISISLSGDIQSPFGLISITDQDKQILLLFFRRSRLSRFGRSRLVMLRRRSWLVMLRRRSWSVMLRRRCRSVMLRRRRGRGMMMVVIVTPGKHQHQPDNQQISQCLHCGCFLSFVLRVIEI